MLFIGFMIYVRKLIGLYLYRIDNYIRGRRKKDFLVVGESLIKIKFYFFNSSVENRMLREIIKVRVISENFGVFFR